MVRFLSVLALFAGASSTAPAQPLMPLQGEVRADVIISSATVVHAGAGLSVPLGTYVRAGFIAAIGTGRGGIDGRTDVIARFQLDPFRQKQWAPYGGGGVSVRYSGDEVGGTRGYLLISAGLEGPVSQGGWAPAFELGLGGGTRIGVALRQGIRGRR